MDAEKTVKKKTIKYSYSRLDTYNQCPFRYWLKYIEGHYAKSGSIALEFGTAIHKAEETVGNMLKAGDKPDYDSIIKEFLDTCIQLQAKYPLDFITPDKNGRTYQEKIDFFVSEGIYRLERLMQSNPNLEILGCEIGFEFTLAGEVFRGSIDRALHDRATDRYYVQDIKSYGAPLKDDQEGRDPHLITPLQFVVYCLAMSEKFPVDPTAIKCCYDLPLCEKAYQDAGTAGFIGRGVKKINELFEKIGERQWEPKATPLCHWCEFCGTNDSADDSTKHLCPYFSHWTREHKTFKKEAEWTGIDDYPTLLEDYHKKYNINS